MLVVFFWRSMNIPSKWIYWSKENSILSFSFIHEMSDVYTFFLRWLGFGRFRLFFCVGFWSILLVAHQLHTSKHNTSTHHDEQIEVKRIRCSWCFNARFLVYRSGLGSFNWIYRCLLFIWWTCTWYIFHGKIRICFIQSTFYFLVFEIGKSSGNSRSWFNLSETLWSFS